MNTLLDQITRKIKDLNLDLFDDDKTKKIATHSFNSVLDYINLNFNPFFDFDSIKHILIDISIGEYLLLIKKSNLIQKIDIDDAVKTISEGDTSVTYFDKETPDQKFDLLINHFLGKKSQIAPFKTINW